MPIRIRTAVAVAAPSLLALLGTYFVLSGFNSRDVIHLHVRSTSPGFYEFIESGDPGFSHPSSAGNDYLPRVSGDGTIPISFPVSSGMSNFRIVPGLQAGSVMIVRLCLERDFFVKHCLEGGRLSQLVTRANDVVVSTQGSLLVLDRKGGNPYIQMDGKTSALLRPPADLRLFFVRLLLAIVSAAFLGSFFYSWIAPLSGFWNLGATVTFALALAIRAIAFHVYGGVAVSDSALFEKYLPQFIFVLPGIRGVIYPAFLSLFPSRGNAIFETQFLLGSLGAVMVFMLLRSRKKPSRFDILFALLATSIPTLVLSECFILSESIAAFLILTAFVAFRELELNRDHALAAAGLGASAALLYNTKPQFGFAILLFVLAILSTQRRVIPRMALFFAPVLSLWLLVANVDRSAGNFSGVSSTLGYSLFDHAQQLVSCVSQSPDPHIQFYCRARAALGPGGQPTTYTAWVIYPAIHELQESFPTVTADYARLSLSLIAAHPASYALSVLRSFRDFWTLDSVMLPGLIHSRNQDQVLLLDRILRWCLQIAFSVSCIAVLFKRFRPDREVLNFCLLMIFTVIGSATVQALAESGNEQGRFAVPTLPLLLLVPLLISFRGSAVKSELPVK